VEKLKSKITNEVKAVLPALSSSDQGHPVPISESEDGETWPYGFFGLKTLTEGTF
jgi:hypothetical protein